MILKRDLPGATVARRWAVLLLLVGAAGGCFHHGGGAPAEEVSGSITIHVTSHNFYDHNIFAVYGSSRTRIGQVTGNSSADFEIPMRRLGINGEFRLRAEPIGSPRTWTSELLHVFAGQVVELTLEASINQSSYSIVD